MNEQDQNENNDRRPFFYTSEGTKYYVRAVAQEKVNMALAAIERRYREDKEPIDPPTYEVETAGGGIETFDHEWDDEKEKGTLETEEDQIAWGKHVIALEKMGAEQNALSRDMWIGGVIFEILPEWLADHEELGIEIPEEKKARKYHFLTTEVLKSTDDFLEALAAVQKASMRGTIDDERVDAFIDTFRDSIQASSTKQWDIAQELRKKALERLDTLDKNERGSDSEGVEDAPETV